MEQSSPGEEFDPSQQEQAKIQEQVLGVVDDIIAHGREIDIDKHDELYGLGGHEYYLESAQDPKLIRQLILSSSLSSIALQEGASMSIPNPNDKTLELDLYATNEILNQIALVALVVDYEELGWTIRLAMRLGYGDIETKSGIEEIIFTVKKWNGTSRKNSMTLERTLYTFLYAGDGYYGHNKVEIRDAMFDEAQSFMDISKKIVQV